MKKRVMSFILIIFLVLNLSPSMYVAKAKTVSDEQTLTFTGTATDYINFRLGPGFGFDSVLDVNGAAIVLPKKQKVTIKGREHDNVGNLWYEVDVRYRGNDYSGYVIAAYIKLDLKSVPVADEKFETKLDEQGFPESYKQYLRYLHLIYPDWEFIAVDTGLSFNEVLNAEKNSSNYHIKNVVWTSDYSPNYNWRSTTVKYNKKKNIWTPCDGDNWFAASDDVVKFYIDPRVYLDESHIFAFESLSYIKDVQKKSGVNAILKGTFMSKSHTAYKDKKKRTYADIIMLAAKKTGVSPYHIASRIRLEMGTKANAAATGSYNGCFNYFNIGAYDGANALVSGLKYAAAKGSYGRPWNTVEKAIVGGAKFLASGYISVGQNTLYTQKFNVTNYNDLFEHQYCTNVQMPYTESVTNYKAYQKMDALDSAIVFEIPVYSNMPKDEAVLPSSEGNPNNYLKSLTVDDYALTPAFKLSNKVSYELTVSSKVKSVTIDAKAAYKKSKILGTGKLSLKKGTNIAYVYVTSESGSVRKYTIKIVRGKPTGTCTYHDPKASETKEVVIGETDERVKLNLNKGTSAYLIPDKNFTNGNEKLTWYTTDAGIVKVTSNGKVKALSRGTATITVKSESGKKAKCKIYVKVPAKKVTLNKTKLTMEKGASKTLKATMTKDSTDKLKWKSSDTKIVKVSSKGKLTAKRSGSAVITVTTTSGKTAKCEVNVK